jgi:WW domain-containing oxidoreductase
MLMEIDTHFQVNHLSQMHLTILFLPILLRTAKEKGDARIVLQSSDLHRMAPRSTKFADIDEINTDIGPSYLYNRTKLAQILFVRQLVQRLQEGKMNGLEGLENIDPAAVENLFINATHPGAVSTEQQKQAEEAYGMLATAAVKVARPFMSEPITQGCLPALWAATAEDVKRERVNGAYTVPPAKVTEPSAMAKDLELGDNLWRLSESLLREKLAEGSIGNDIM